MRLFRRMFVACGLITLALPGVIVWSHSNRWWVVGAGGLAGLVTAAIDPGGKP